MKNDILNWVLFCPKKEWNPHSKALFFSWYGLWGESKMFIPKSTKDKKGIKRKKNVKLDILKFLIYKVKEKNKEKKYKLNQILQSNKGLCTYTLKTF